MATHVLEAIVALPFLMTVPGLFLPLPAVRIHLTGLVGHL